MKRTQSDVYSIFGQIDSIVAQQMVDEGKLNKIEAAMIPHSAKFDEAGRQAFFAVIVPRAFAAEFDRRIRELAA
jgi:hypothetical protein